MTKRKPLDHRHEAAIEVLARGGSTTEAAQAAGTTDRTVRAWRLDHAEFRAELAKRTLSVNSRLAQVAPAAVERLDAIARDPETPISDRRRANETLARLGAGLKAEAAAAGPQVVSVNFNLDRSELRKLIRTSTCTTLAILHGIGAHDLPEVDQDQVHDARHCQATADLAAAIDRFVEERIPLPDLEELPGGRGYFRERSNFEERVREWAGKAAPEPPGDRYHGERDSAVHELPA